MLLHVIGNETAIREKSMDDQMMRRIRAKQIIHAPEDGPVSTEELSHNDTHCYYCSK
jgi:hypothetical protein